MVIVEVSGLRDFLDDEEEFVLRGECGLPVEELPVFDEPSEVGNAGGSGLRKTGMGLPGLTLCDAMMYV